jgi:hypothetical protein
LLVVEFGVGVALGLGVGVGWGTVPLLAVQPVSHKTLNKKRNEATSIRATDIFLEPRWDIDLRNPEEFRCGTLL